MLVLLCWRHPERPVDALLAPLATPRLPRWQRPARPVGDRNAAYSQHWQ
ncbi:MAG: hypothetical protein ACJ8DI_05090 [Ktedonobacteraceae bacterium]